VRVARLKAGLKLPGRLQRKIREKEEGVILAFLASHPQTTLKELGAHLVEETGTLVGTWNLSQTLKRLGIRRERPRRTGRAEDKARTPRRYGYVSRHRREQLGLRYPSDLTDDEWSLVRDLFEHDGRGRPPAHDRRAMLEAICYVLHSGCPWRMLPKDFPPWSAVYPVFRRWASKGRFEAMNDRLRARYRIRVGRNINPTAAVIDSQSVKTAEKGGPWDMTRTRRSEAASVTR
jgi:transposase